MDTDKHRYLLNAKLEYQGVDNWGHTRLRGPNSVLFGPCTGASNCQCTQRGWIATRFSDSHFSTVEDPEVIAYLDLLAAQGC